MASGSFFVVLRERPDKELTDEEITRDETGAVREERLQNSPQLLCMNKHTYADTAKNIALDVLAVFGFCSPLNTLAKDYFGLNPYSGVTGADRVELKYADVHKIWQALQYITAGEYSKTMEDILDNPYIDVFSDMSSSYISYKYQCEDRIADDLETDTLLLLRDVSKCMLTLMREAEDCENIRVLYVAW